MPQVEELRLPGAAVITGGNTVISLEEKQSVIQHRCCGDSVSVSEAATDAHDLGTVCILAPFSQFLNS